MFYSWTPPAFISLYPPLCDIAPNTLFPSASVSDWQLSSISVRVTVRQNHCTASWGRMVEDRERTRNCTQQNSPNVTFFLPLCQGCNCLMKHNVSAHHVVLSLLSILNALVYAQISFKLSWVKKKTIQFFKRRSYLFPRGFSSLLESSLKSFCISQWY